jgi:hypothetical protein
MAAPAVIGAVGLGASALSGGVSAFGSIFGGQAAANQANYQAGIATMNANIARQNASYELAKGEVEAQQSGMKTRYQIGSTKAIQGASGIDVNRGTAPLVRTSEAEVGSMNEATIRAGAARKAYGLDVEAAGLDATAQLDKMSASNAKTASYISAASSILGSAGSVSSNWLKMNQSGVWGNSKVADFGTNTDYGS